MAIAGRREDKLRQAAGVWEGQPSILTHTVDVTDRASVGELFRWADATLGRVDILVNNAGMNTRQRTLADMPPETWDQVMLTNATGAYNCLIAVLPQMRARGDGLIVNISSISGLRERAGGRGLWRVEIRAHGAVDRRRARGREAQHSGDEHLSRRSRHANSRRAPKAVSPEHRAKILQPADVAEAVLMVACLPPRAHVHELVIKPTWQEFA